MIYLRQPKGPILLLWQSLFKGLDQSMLGNFRSCRLIMELTEKKYKALNNSK